MYLLKTCLILEAELGNNAYKKQTAKNNTADEKFTIIQ